MLHVCLSWRQKICCCSDFKSLWRAAVSPDCTCALPFAEHSLHQVRYDTVVIHIKVSLLHNNKMCAYDHHSTRSGEVFLSQIWSVSTTPFASTPPQSSKNSPVKELVIMSRCACVFHMHVRVYTYIYGYFIHSRAFSFAYNLVRFEKTLLLSPSIHWGCEGRADEVALLWRSEWSLSSHSSAGPSTTDGWCCVLVFTTGLVHQV